MYTAGAIGILAFVVAQTCQQFLTAEWIPYAILGTIVWLLVPYTALAITRFSQTPMAAVMGMIFFTFFVLSEAVARGTELFGAATDLRGWHFVTMTSYLLASVSFGVATWRDEARWHWLAPAAFAVNVLRLSGRIASTFGGVTALDALNDSAYYAFVLAVNGPLFIWFYLKSRSTPCAITA
jgi:hypothetical protein